MNNTSNITTISDLKKSPKNVFNIAKKERHPIIIYNNNKANGVIMDMQTYTDMENTINTLNEKIFDLETAIRLKTNTKSWSAIEVQGNNKNINLDSTHDEWI